MVPPMASPGHEAESKQLLEAQLRATLDVIPAYAWYANPSGGFTFVTNELRITLVSRKTISSISESTWAQRRILICRIS